MRDSVAFAKDKDPAMTYVVNAPKADIYVIDVSFQALKDKSERDYLNRLPTSFVLSDEAVDRLRAAAATIILDSPDFQQLLKDEGARIARSARYGYDGAIHCGHGPDRRAQRNSARACPATSSYKRYSDRHCPN